MVGTVISIISGSVRRTAALRRMLESARKAMPFGVPYEFVIVTIVEDALSLLISPSDCGLSLWMKEE